MIGLILRLVNVLFQFFPTMADITASFSQSLNLIIAQAMGWNWIFPIREALSLVVVAIQFEIGIVFLMFGKWILEMVRGK
jgi:hypothetical protein